MAYIFWAGIKKSIKIISTELNKISSIILFKHHLTYTSTLYGTNFNISRSSSLDSTGINAIHRSRSEFRIKIINYSVDWRLNTSNLLKVRKMKRTNYFWVESLRCTWITTQNDHRSRQNKIKFKLDSKLFTYVDSTEKLAAQQRHSRTFRPTTTNSQ